jgi:AcrR family transcriptional regulator
MDSPESAPAGRLSRIISAAQRCLARDGYANVSIKDIAREAGVAPGLLHYYFECKEDLLVAAVREAANRYRVGFFDQFRPSSDLAQSINNSIVWASHKLREDPTWFLLLFELYNLSLRDERIRSELLIMIREERAAVTKAVSALLDASPEQLGLSAEFLGTWILAIFDGVIIHAMIDPSVDPIENLAVVARAVSGLLPPRQAN